MRYHYITVLGHPSNSNWPQPWSACGVPLHYSSGASFQIKKGLSCDHLIGTITLQFWGILPTHKKILNNKKKRTITLQFWGILPTGDISECGQAAGYHYITVLGHPSNVSMTILRARKNCTITLQFWGILPTPPLRF